MKNIFKTILIFICLITLGFVVKKSFSAKDSNSQSTPLPALGATQNEDIEYTLKADGEEYAFFWLEVEDLYSLELIPNFQERLTSQEAVIKYNCKSLVNGGFYLKDNSPAGYFVSEGGVLKNWSYNTLFNGVLSINDLATPRITWEVPRDSLRIALQTGPVLIENAQRIRLKTTSDDLARRVMAAITGENRLYFIVVYNPTQVFDGPKLKDLDDVLSQIEDKLGIVFADAINLDGGSASVFYSDDVELAEISFVGSFFCLK
jgi:exopolysaccharide biosynthesis protein